MDETLDDAAFIEEQEEEDADVRMPTSSAATSRTRRKDNQESVIG